MTDHVISYRQPRRKRGGQDRAEKLRRLAGAALIAMAALALASWLAIQAVEPRIEPATLGGASPEETPPLMLIIEAPAPAPASPIPRAQRPQNAARGIPLDAVPEGPAEDYEVLSAGELDSISQARD